MIGELRKRIVEGSFEFSKHAVDQSILRKVREAFASGEVIEDYPENQYGPSCMVSGMADSGRPIHVHCSHPTRTPVKITTLYEPHPALWLLDFRERRRR
ncbi:DUF4258 domain-containing protein [Rubrobacter indicoceani]|uniref:DUF4258 domain-containing protein n=1 Tax=Rubrobacter indicoceani TaxID=2051957 RepID=UPI000E5C49E1